MMWLPATSRRVFLRTTTFSAGMVALSHLRAAPAAAAQAAVSPAGTGLRGLTTREAAILTAIAERIVDTGDPAMPRFRDTRALETIDLTLLQLDRDVREQFRQALVLFEYGPLLFQLTLARFTELSLAEREAHIETWRRSRFTIRRLAYRAMKNVSFLGYYAQDSTWKGIHYGGPWLPRPRRVVKG